MKRQKQLFSFFGFHNNKQTLAMTDDVLQFLQIIFRKGKNIFSDAGFFFF